MQDHTTDEDTEGDAKEEEEDESEEGESEEDSDSSRGNKERGESEESEEDEEEDENEEDVEEDESEIGSKRKRLSSKDEKKKKKVARTQDDGTSALSNWKRKGSKRARGAHRVSWETVDPPVPSSCLGCGAKHPTGKKHWLPRPCELRAQRMAIA